MTLAIRLYYVDLGNIKSLQLKQQLNGLMLLKVTINSFPRDYEKWNASLHNRLLEIPLEMTCSIRIGGPTCCCLMLLKVTINSLPRD